MKEVLANIHNENSRLQTKNHFFEVELKKAEILQQKVTTPLYSDSGPEWRNQSPVLLEHQSERRSDFLQVGPQRLELGLTQIGRTAWNSRTPNGISVSFT